MSSRALAATLFGSRASGILLLCSLCAFLPACSDSDSTNRPEPVADPNDSVPAPTQDSISVTLNNRMDYGTLLLLIENADLAEALQEDNSGLGWTLFAPSDDAFGNDAFESLTLEQQTERVRLHLYSGQLSYSDLMVGVLNMTQGTVQVEQAEDGTIRIGGARIVARDRVVGNGVIHFVDQVLLPSPL